MNILTDINGNNYVEITPIVINALLSQTATRFYTHSIYDNLVSQAIFSCYVADETCARLYGLPEIIMAGSDYTSWDSSALGAFTYVLSQLPDIHAI